MSTTNDQSPRVLLLGKISGVAKIAPLLVISVLLAFTAISCTSDTDDASSSDSTRSPLTPTAFYAIASPAVAPSAVPPTSTPAYPSPVADTVAVPDAELSTEAYPSVEPDETAIPTIAELSPTEETRKVPEVSPAPTPEAIATSEQPADAKVAPSVSTATASPTSIPKPSPTPARIQADYIYLVAEVPMSLRIALSEVIAIGRFVSAEPFVATGSEPSYYRSYIRLKFHVSQYLKGNDGEELTVFVDDYGIGERVIAPPNYRSLTDAQLAAERLLHDRPKLWDDRDAVLFLQDVADPEYRRRDTWLKHSGINLGYTFTHPIWTPGLEEMTIMGLNKVWLPERNGLSGASASAASNDGERYFMTSSPTDATGAPDAASNLSSGLTPSHTAVSLTALKNQIARSEAALQLDPDYVRGLRYRYDLFIPSRTYSQGVPTEVKFQLDSGQPLGTTVGEIGWFSGDQYYSMHVLSGTDATLFESRIIDPGGDPSDGYHVGEFTKRPLPAGTYKLGYKSYPCEDSMCAAPTSQKPVDWIVQSVQPRGVLHEAFFDPVAMSSPQGAIGEDMNESVIVPSNTPGSNTPATLTQLFFESKTLKLVMDPYHSLSDYRLDVIKLDGTVGWSFRFDQSSKSQVGSLNAHEWQYCGTPWQAGDQLMIRIIQKGASTSAALSAEARNAPGCPVNSPTPTPTETATPTATPTEAPTPSPTATPTPTPTPAAAEGPRISISDARAREGSDLVFKVTLDTWLHGGVHVNFTSHPVTATEGTDYQSFSSNLIFSGFEDEKTIKIRTRADSDAEGEETMRVVLSDPIGGVIVDGEGVGTITE